MKAIAIDFETALPFKAIYNRSESAQAACSIGLASVQEDGIELLCEQLIRPSPFEMDDGSFKIHNISLSSLADADSFSQLWEKIKRYFFWADTLIAHNARFDARVLVQSMTYCGLPIPNIDVVDTLEAVRGWNWPIEHHALDDCCNYLKVDLTHHTAGSDAIGCGHIFKKLVDEGCSFHCKPLSSF